MQCTIHKNYKKLFVKRYILNEKVLVDVQKSNVYFGKAVGQFSSENFGHILLNAIQKIN